jgi:AcrR family transcriptional regulator
MRRVEEMEETEETGPSRRTRLNAVQRRESILAAAVEVFSAAGYRAGKVSDVAALVGVSEPVIFQNFGSKAALFATVVDRVAGDVQAELERLAGQPGSAAGLLAHALEPGHPHGAPGHPPGPGAAEAGPHAHGPGAAEAGPHTHGFGAHGVLFSDAFALIGEPELTEAARRAARTIADHLADLIRRGQADGDIRADLDPGPVAWLLLSVLSTRAFRTAVAPDHDRVEDGITALALRLLDPGLLDPGIPGPGTG